MKNKIYVGNLPYAFTVDELTQLFSGFGTVINTVVVKDKETGCSRGFGFVTFMTSCEAQAALSMGGQYVRERKLFLKIARERQTGVLSKQKDNTNKEEFESNDGSITKINEEFISTVTPAASYWKGFFIMILEKKPTAWLKLFIRRLA